MPKSKHRKAHKTKVAAARKNAAQEKMHQEHRMRLMFEMMLKEQERLASEQTNEDINDLLPIVENISTEISSEIPYADVVSELQIEQ